MTTQRLLWIPRAAGILLALSAAANAQFTPGPGSPTSVNISNPSSVAVGDFNRDGKLDLAVANWGNKTVTVLLGDGTGGFQKNHLQIVPGIGLQFPAGTYPYSVVVGDFNADGLLDLAVANGGDNTVTILEGNGGGGFLAAPGSPFQVGSFPYSLAVGYFQTASGNFIDDLAIGNQGSNNVSMLYGYMSPGTIGPGPLGPLNPPFPTGTDPVSVVTADFNLDGKPDLAVANADSNSITLLLGTGEGGFTTAPFGLVLASSYPLGFSPGKMAVGDFNGDGRPDLAILSGNTVTILLGITSANRFAPAPGSPFIVESTLSSIAVGDFNGDGHLDLAVTSESSNDVTVLLGDGTGRFTAAPGSPYQTGNAPTSVAVVDLNGDGRPDLAISNAVDNTITVLLNSFPPLAPAPVSPANGAIGLSLTPTLSWNASGFATSYDVHFGTSSPPPLFTSTTGTAAGVGTLSGGTTYYWQIVAKDSAGSTASAIWSFTTLVVTPPAPVLISPANGATGVSLTPTLTWNASSGAASYDVYFGGTHPPVLVANTTGTSYAPATLVGGALYYWQIVAKNSAGSASSATWSFTTQASALPAPVLTSPANGATGVSLSPNLFWNGSSGATAYDVYLGTSPSPPEAGATASTAYTPGTLSAGTTYYWYVVATNNSSTSSPSPTWSFTTQVSAPPAPVLTSPANGATGVSLAPTLTWNASAGATSYDVYFGTAAPPPLATNTTGTSYGPGTLAGGTTYYWQVVAKNASGSAGSATWSFTTQSSAPPAPVLSYPAAGATGVTVAPTLVWNASAGAASYDVYFGASSPPPLAGNTTGTSYAVGTLSANATYYWQVVAKNAVASAASVIWSFTTGTAPVGLHFVPVTPCRVADTRGPSGPFGGPTMTADSSRSFAIPQSACGIPATAEAYSLNVTVVPQGPLSYLTLWPTGQTPPFVSTLNSFGGIVVANAAIVPAGSGGAVSVFVTNTTDVILDINGYFGASSGTSSYSFYPATPCRVADTRGPSGQFGGPSMYAGQTRDFPIPLSACAIPSDVTAYSLNVTVVPDGPLSYLSLWPTGQTQPLVSTLNSWTGKVVANAALVPAGSNESISVFVTNPTDVILDINGYIGVAGYPGALSFYPVTPCRVADTRNAAGPFGGPEMEAGTTRSFTIPASACNIPSNAAAYSLNVTVVPDGALSYLSAWPTGLAQPVVSTLNSFDGSVVANAAIVPAGTDAAISIFVTNPTQVILDINGYFAP
jgi:hypothetical protein